MTSRIGTLKTWGARGFGKVSVRCTDGKIENYWLHVSDIEYSEPEEAFPGCSVVFETTGVAPVEGKFPACKRAKVYLPAPSAGPTTVAAVTAALSGGKPEAEPKEGR